jgi:hypothetical protein
VRKVLFALCAILFLIGCGKNRFEGTWVGITPRGTGVLKIDGSKFVYEIKDPGGHVSLTKGRTEPWDDANMKEEARSKIIKLLPSESTIDGQQVKLPEMPWLTISEDGTQLSVGDVVLTKQEQK